MRYEKGPLSSGEHYAVHQMLAQFPHCDWSSEVAEALINDDRFPWSFEMVRTKQTLFRRQHEETCISDLMVSRECHKTARLLMDDKEVTPGNGTFVGIPPGHLYGTVGYWDHVLRCRVPLPRNTSDKLPSTDRKTPWCFKLELGADSCGSIPHSAHWSIPDWWPHSTRLSNFIGNGARRVEDDCYVAYWIDWVDDDEGINVSIADDKLTIHHGSLIALQPGCPIRFHEEVTLWEYKLPRQDWYAQICAMPR